MIKQSFLVTLEPGSCIYWAHVLQLLNAMSPRAHASRQEKPLQWEACALQLESRPCSPQLEKGPEQQWWLSAAKIKYFKNDQTNEILMQ